MMRSPSLQNCLDTPFLWFDETANTLVKKDLEGAEKFLKEWPSRKDFLEQMNTIYQAMYCATMALVHSINYKASGFRCVVTVLEEYFVKKGLISMSLVDDLIRAQKLDGTLEQNGKGAEEYIAKVKEVLKV